MDEMREMTMTEFIALTDLAFEPGDDEGTEKQVATVREATQADIDHFF